MCPRSSMAFVLSFPSSSCRTWSIDVGLANCFDRKLPSNIPPAPVHWLKIECVRCIDILYLWIYAYTTPLLSALCSSLNASCSLLPFAY